MNIIYLYSTLCGKLDEFDSTRTLETIIDKILQFFPELETVNSLMYFHHRFSLRNIGASIYPLKYPKSGLQRDYPGFAQICEQYVNLDFFIYCTNIITTGDCTARAINISHEFQHASQYTLDTKTYLYGCIIRNMLNHIISEVRSPIEYDAERKSKIIAIDLCGEKKVNETIENMLSDPDVPKEFWQVFKSINIEEKFDLVNSIQELWEYHNIEGKIQQYKKNRTPTYDQQKVIEMYDFANY
jgi:hypothetical protein